MSHVFVSAAALEANDLAEFNGCQAMLKELVRSRLCSSFASFSVRDQWQHTGSLLCAKLFSHSCVSSCLQGDSGCGPALAVITVS